VKLDERLDPGDLNRPPAVSAAETHRTGAGANGVVGSQNQRGRYGAGAVLWTSDQFHERTGPGGDTRNRAGGAKTLTDLHQHKKKTVPIIGGFKTPLMGMEPHK
jgi:hypothetical protein